MRTSYAHLAKPLPTSIRGKNISILSKNRSDFELKKSRNPLKTRYIFRPSSFHSIQRSVPYFPYRSHVQNILLYRIYPSSSKVSYANPSPRKKTPRKKSAKTAKPGGLRRAVANLKRRTQAGCCLPKSRPPPGTPSKESGSGTTEARGTRKMNAGRRHFTNCCPIGRT